MIEQTSDSVASLLRTAILSGSLPPGTTLPSARDFAQENGVSQATVTAAYRLLSQEGFLTHPFTRARYIVVDAHILLSKRRLEVTERIAEVISSLLSEGYAIIDIQSALLSASKEME